MMADMKPISTKQLLKRLRQEGHDWWAGSRSYQCLDCSWFAYGSSEHRCYAHLLEHWIEKARQ